MRSIKDLLLVSRDSDTSDTVLVDALKLTNMKNK